MRGRRGGEKKRGRRGIIVGGMVLGLLMGCNNGGELEAEKRLGDIGRSTENVFYEFMGLIADTLGFRVTTKTTKKEVGEHFSKLGTQIGEASKELEKVEEKAASADGDKDGLLGKTIREAVDAVKKTLKELKGYVEALKAISDGEKVGDSVNTNKFGEAPDDVQLKTVFRALNGIIGIATDLGIRALKAGDTTLTINTVDNKDGAKILSTKTDNPGADDAGKATVILAAVSGEEMLDAIVNKSEENDKALETNANDKTTAMSFARGGQATHLANNANPKAAAVAGGIALRSLIKGKLGAGAAAKSAGGQEEVQGVGVIAANKLLEAVEGIIKKAVKETLKKAKDKIDEARAPKTVGQK